MATLTRREAWRDEALCRFVEHDVFFPHHTLSESRWDNARLVCAFCPVRKQCLNVVIGLDDNDDRWGMFGGLTPAQRKKLRKKQKTK